MPRRPTWALRLINVRCRPSTSSRATRSLRGDSRGGRHGDVAGSRQPEYQVDGYDMAGLVPLIRTRHPRASVLWEISFAFLIWRFAWMAADAGRGGRGSRRHRCSAWMWTFGLIMLAAVRSCPAKSCIHWSRPRLAPGSSASRRPFAALSTWPRRQGRAGSQPWRPTGPGDDPDPGEGPASWVNHGVGRREPGGLVEAARASQVAGRGPAAPRR